MSALEQWYASGGTQHVIPTLEIRKNGADPRYYYAGGYESVELVTEDGSIEVFEPSPMEVALTARDNSGSQKLTFGFQNVTPEILEYVEATRSESEEVTITYRKYLSDNLDEPEDVIIMTAISASIEDDIATIQCGHFDIINTQFNRAKYTASKYPGLRGMR